MAGDVVVLGSQSSIPMGESGMVSLNRCILAAPQMTRSIYISKWAVFVHCFEDHSVAVQMSQMSNERHSKLLFISIRREIQTATQYLSA